MKPSINTPYPLDQESPEDVALDFYALLAYFERALLRAGFRTGGPQHSRGLPDWEGFARSIAPRFAQVTDPNAVGSAAILLGISVRTFEDVGGDASTRAIWSGWRESSAPPATAWPTLKPSPGADPTAICFSGPV